MYCDLQLGRYRDIGSPQHARKTPPAPVCRPSRSPFATLARHSRRTGVYRGPHTLPYVYVNLLLESACPTGDATRLLLLLLNEMKLGLCGGGATPELVDISRGKPTMWRWEMGDGL